MSLSNTPDICFVDVGNDTHVGQVFGDGEKGRCLETGSHGLSFFHFLAQHDTVDGRGDSGIADIGFGLLHAFFRSVVSFQSLAVVQIGHFVIVPAHESLFVQRFIAFVIGRLVVQFAFGTRQIGPGTVQFTVEGRFVQFRDDLAFLHEAVIVHIYVADDAGDLCTDFYLRYRFDGSCGGYAVTDGIRLYVGHFKLHGHTLLGPCDYGNDCCDGHNGNRDDNFLFFHMASVMFLKVDTFSLIEFEELDME